MPDIAALMALRVQGVASSRRLACALGTQPEEARLRAAALVEAGLAGERSGRLEGWSLTPEGISTLEKALAQEGLRDDDQLHDAYDRFMLLNRRLLEIASDWQVRRSGGVEEPNDHSDPAYDHGVIDRLSALHPRACECVGRLDGCAARFGPYRARLQHCLDRALAGDRSAITAALDESYHTVWFELHQDLILTLGVERQE